jgi:hypothetical protein
MSGSAVRRIAAFVLVACCRGTHWHWLRFAAKIGTSETVPHPEEARWLHKADDEQVPLADARALIEAWGSPDKTLRVFPAEGSGAQRCPRDYLSLGAATLFDWLEDKLVCNR